MSSIRREPPETFSDYQLTGLLADGRMGRVYRATSQGVEGFEKSLCVKIIDAALTEHQPFVDALVEEAKRAVSLSHANIVQVYDLGREDESGDLYIAEEYVNGLDLKRAIDRSNHAGRPWPRDLALYVVSEVAKGLDYAHRRKDFNFDNLDIVHRGLSPSNILLSEGGEVKITDFGLSRALEVLHDSQQRDPRARFLYAAPEYAEHLEAIPRSDLFALGLIAYEMLTGLHPYRGTDRPVREAAIEADIPPLQDHVDLPSEVTTVIEAMLARHPRDRLDSAGAVYEQLIGYLFEHDLRSDDRALSTFLDDLRSEDGEWQEGEAPGETNAGDEIAADEMQDFFRRSSDSFQAPDEWIRDLEESRMHAPPPTDQLDDVVSAPEGSLPELPDPLESHVREAQAGSGRALLLSGHFGRGVNYLPDRLIESLDWRDDIRAVALHVTSTDAHRPFGALADLVPMLVEASLPDETEPDRRAHDLLAELGASRRALDALAVSWGLSEAERLCRRDVQPDLAEALALLLREIGRDETLVLVVDRLERLDEATFEILQTVIDELSSLSILFVMTTRTPGAIRDRLDPDAREPLVPLRMSAPESDRHQSLSGLSEAAKDVLMMLSLTERPLSHWAIAEVQELDESTVADAAEELLAADLLRSPGRGQLLAAFGEENRWIAEQFEPRAIASAARRLAHYLRREPGGAAISRVPTFVRLAAIARDYRNVRARMKRYREWLENNDWRDMALDFDHYCHRLLSRRHLGRPTDRRRHLLESAERALTLGDVEGARRRLDRFDALVESSPSARNLVRARLLRAGIAMHEDELPDARPSLRRALEEATALGDTELVVRSHVMLGRWYERFGDGLQAQRHVERARRLVSSGRETDLDPDVPLRLLAMAVRLSSRLDTMKRATDALRDLRSRVERHDRPLSRIREARARAEWHLRRGEEDAAFEAFERSRHLARDADLEWLEGETARRQAEAALRHDRLEVTRHLADQLLTGRIPPSIEPHARALRAAADHRLDETDADSLDVLESALERARQRGVPRDVHRSHRRLAVALADRDPERAERHRQLAREWLDRMYHRPDTSEH
jgi:serine/threonine protein kinase